MDSKESRGFSAFNIFPELLEKLEYYKWSVDNLSIKLLPAVNLGKDVNVKLSLDCFNPIPSCLIAALNKCNKKYQAVFLSASSELFEQINSLIYDLDMDEYTLNLLNYKFSDFPADLRHSSLLKVFSKTVLLIALETEKMEYQKLRNIVEDLEEVCYGNNRIHLQLVFISDVNLDALPTDKLLIKPENIYLGTKASKHPSTNTSNTSNTSSTTHTSSTSTSTIPASTSSASSAPYTPYTPSKEYASFDDMPIFESDEGSKLLQGIIEYGFERPSPIQQIAIMPIAEGRDAIVQARSGTGKTGAFTIGILSRIEHKLRSPQAIVISHTHELARQTAHVISKIGYHLKTSVELCIGGHGSANVSENISNIHKGRHVIVGTPGRIQDLINKKGFDLSLVKVLIVDEADKLLSCVFLDSLGKIMEDIDNAVYSRGNSRLQVGFFSATMSDDIIQKMSTCMHDPVKILVPVENLTLDGIRQFKLRDKPSNGMGIFDHKARMLLAINSVKSIPQAIIYVNNCRSAHSLSAFLNDNDMSTDVISGDMSSFDREKIVTSFRTGGSRILISTDLLSRGFDVQQVMMVINFDLPYTSRKGISGTNHDMIAEYLHRIGRSGRFGRKGVAINLIATDAEEERARKIQEYYNIEMEDLPENLKDIF